MFTEQLGGSLCVYIHRWSPNWMVQLQSFQTYNNMKVIYIRYTPTTYNGVMSHKCLTYDIFQLTIDGFAETNPLVTWGASVYLYIHDGVCLYINACIYTPWAFEGLCQGYFCFWSLAYCKTQEIEHYAYYRQNYAWVYSNVVCRKDSWIFY